MVSLPFTEDWLKKALSNAVGVVPVVPPDVALSDQLLPVDHKPVVVVFQ